VQVCGAGLITAADVAARQPAVPYLGTGLPRTFVHRHGQAVHRA
jgi:hypothetical protein